MIRFILSIWLILFNSILYGNVINTSANGVNDRLFLFAQVYGTARYFSTSDNFDAVYWDEIRNAGILYCLDPTVQELDFRNSLEFIFFPMLKFKWDEKDEYKLDSIESSVKYTGIINPKERRKIKSSREFGTSQSAIFNGKEILFAIEKKAIRNILLITVKIQSKNILLNLIFQKMRLSRHL